VLPRFAKGGIAVLLAVALLGWAIVAYSAKRQHDDVRSRDSALATLKGQADSEGQALVELQTIKEQFAVAETELASSREAVAASRDEKSDLDAKLAELEAELEALRETSGDTSGNGEALALLKTEDGTDEASADAEPSALVDAETLRARLTKTMTALSAKNAMLQQRDRDLERTQAEAEAAATEIETMKAALEERDLLRTRLTENMTTLSAKTATVQQRERELASLQGDHDQALTMIDSLKGDIESLEADIKALEVDNADRETVGRSLDVLTAQLTKTQQELSDGADALEANQSALDDQRVRVSALTDEQAAIEAVIGERQAEADQLEEKLAALTSDVSKEGEKLAAQSSSLTAEIDSLQASLSEKEDAIAAAETELARLEEEIATAQELLIAKEGEAEEKRVFLSQQNSEIQEAEASLAAVKATQTDAEAETLALKNAIDRQQGALDDLASLKGELDDTQGKLARQTALLSKRQGEIMAADTRLEEIRQASTSESSGSQSLPSIPIAELSEDTLAILPIDPLYVPFPVQTPKGVRLAQVHFDFASHELTPGGSRKAKEAAAWIKKQDVEKIRLVGFTDSIGTKANNKALAERRAHALLKLLEEEGVDRSRVEIVASGEDDVQEMIPDQTAEPLNRCVGIFVSTGS